MLACACDRASECSCLVAALRALPVSVRWLRGVMAHLYRDVSVKSLYRDRKFSGDNRDWQRSLEQSTTLYIGNLSFYTTEEQLYALFGRVGEVKRVVMGLDRHTKTPCGFCFVEYYRRPDTEDAVRYVNGCKLDDRIVRVDWDGGFVEGRQYGRGRSGGQVRDEYRADYDAGRGGWGKAADGMPSAHLSTQPVVNFGARRQSMPGGTGMRAPARADPDDEPSAKRSRVVEANPRFRADKNDDDDDDDDDDKAGKKAKAEDDDD